MKATHHCTPCGQSGQSRDPQEDPPCPAITLTASEGDMMAMEELGKRLVQ